MLKNHKHCTNITKNIERDFSHSNNLWWSSLWQQLKAFMSTSKFRALIFAFHITVGMIVQIDLVPKVTTTTKNTTKTFWLLLVSRSRGKWPDLWTNQSEILHQNAVCQNVFIWSCEKSLFLTNYIRFIRSFPTCLLIDF